MDTKVQTVVQPLPSFLPAAAGHKARITSHRGLHPRQGAPPMSKSCSRHPCVTVPLLPSFPVPVGSWWFGRGMGLPRPQVWEAQRPLWHALFRAAALLFWLSMKSWGYQHLEVPLLDSWEILAMLLQLKGNILKSKDYKAESFDFEKLFNKKVLMNKSQIFNSLCKTTVSPSRVRQSTLCAILCFFWFCTVFIGLCLNLVLFHLITFLLLQGEYI